MPVATSAIQAEASFGVSNSMRVKAAIFLVVVVPALVASSGQSDVIVASLTIVQATKTRMPFGASAGEIERILGAPILTLAKKDFRLPKSCVYVLQALTASDGRPATIEVAFDREMKSRVFGFRYAGEVGVDGDPRTKKYPPVPESFVQAALAYFPGEWTRTAPWVHVTKDGRLRAHVIAGVLSVWVVRS